MRILSRLIVTAAVAGAAALLPLAAAAPAHADGIPTSATLTVTATQGTVVQGSPVGWTVRLDENPGGQPNGLTGRIDIEVTQNGKTLDSLVRRIASANQGFASNFVVQDAGPISVAAIFVPSTENESTARGAANIIVVGKATVSVQATSVHAGDAITAVVDLPNGSATADGRMQATAPGMPTLVCGPAVVSATSRACPLDVPKDLPSGHYTMTFTYDASPEYADASTTADIDVIGTASDGTSGSTRTGTSGSTTRTATGSGTAAGTTVLAAGAATGTGIDDGTGTADDAAATPGPTGTPEAQPTAVAAAVPGARPAAAGPETPAGSPLIRMLPLLIPFAAAGLIAVALVVLLIVLLVRRSRRARVA